VFNVQTQRCKRKNKIIRGQPSNKIKFENFLRKEAMMPQQFKCLLVPLSQFFQLSVLLSDLSPERLGLQLGIDDLLPERLECVVPGKRGFSEQDLELFVERLVEDGVLGLDVCFELSKNRDLSVRYREVIPDFDSLRLLLYRSPNRKSINMKREEYAGR
jgi:hypothetical protein